MSLSDRIRIACQTCEGYGVIIAEDDEVDDCPACRTNPGHDLAADARLADLVARLPAIISDVRDSVPNPCVWPSFDLAADAADLDALAALLGERD